MLRGIPSVIPPELMKILMEMGHGDEIVIGDRNFPAASIAQRLVRCDGHSIPEILEAIIKFFPLDYVTDYKVSLMAVPPGNPYKPTIWEEYYPILKNSEENFSGFEYLAKADFYDRARKAYAVIATGEKARFGNMILRKGIIDE